MAAPTSDTDGGHDAEAGDAAVATAPALLSIDVGEALLIAAGR